MLERLYLFSIKIKKSLETLEKMSFAVDEIKKGLMLRCLQWMLDNKQAPWGS